MEISICFIQVPYEDCKDEIMRMSEMESNCGMMVTNITWHMEVY